MRKMFGALLAAALLFFMAGCGGDAGGSGETKNASSRLNKDNFGKEIAHAQNDQGSYSFTIEIEDSVNGDGTLEGYTTLTEDPYDADTIMTIESDGETMDIVMVDRVMYLGMGDGTYLAMSLDDPSFADSQYDSSSETGLVGDPEAFAESCIEFEEVGSGGEIDGVETTQYHIVVDSQGLIDEGLVSGDDYGSGDVPEELTYEVWVGNDDSLPRRITSELPDGTMTMDFYDWGKEQDVEAPSSDVVYTMDDVYSGAYDPYGTDPYATNDSYDYSY